MREIRSTMNLKCSSNSSLFGLCLILQLLISTDSLVTGPKHPITAQEATNLSSNNSFVPLKTLKIAHRLRPNSTTHLSTNEPHDLVNLNTHETSSSSTQQSFFDLMNRDKDSIIDENYLIGISHGSPDSNYYTSDSKLINRFRQPLLMNEYDLRAQLSPVPFAQAIESSGPQMYEAHTNYPIGGATNQLENSFYVNMMGAQPVPMNNDRLQDEGTSSDFSNNQYANPTNDVYSPLIAHGPHQNYIGNMNPHDYAKQAYMANLQRFGSSSANDHSARNQKILTNAQIVSLIDELKEFNSRKLKSASSAGSKTVPKSSRRKHTDDQQASKIDRAVNEFAKNLRKTQENDSDDDAKKNNNNSDDDQDSEDESERREDDGKNEDDDELKKEDLQKLASFIIEQQKENKRLVNSQRKKLSDGDDDEADMRDTLLENSRKIRTNDGAQSSVKNTKEFPTDNTQLLELLKKLSVKTNVDDSNSYEDSEKTADRDDSDKARKRRANENISASSNSLDSSIDTYNSPLLHLITNNLNSFKNTETSTTPKNKPSQFDKETWIGRQPQPKSKEPIDNSVNKRIGDFTGVNDSHSSNQEGEEDSDYPRSERMKDLETLRQGLAKSREAQMKLSRLPLPMGATFRDALSNELTKVTDQTIIETSGNEDDKTDTRNSKSIRDEPEVGEESTNSDLSPSRAEPEVSTRKQIKKTTKHPVLEEYPISETVNDRINKLSRNLDRYFDDGFLDKFENKSQAHVKSTINQGSRVKILTEPMMKNETVTLEKKKKLAKDDDFDINVAIDGKRDTTESEDESSEDKEGQSRRGSFHKSSTQLKRLLRGGTKQDEKVKKFKMQSNESPAKYRRHASNREEAYHNKQPKTVKFDPVDSETLDTPIGPDDKKQSKVRGIEKSKGSKERLSSYSRNGEKFFKEPD